MKLFLEILKIIGLSIAIGLLVLYFTKSNHVRCSALNAFSNKVSIALFFNFLRISLIAIGIWVVGFITYFMIRKKKQINLFVYFSLLTILSLHSLIIEASTREPEINRTLKQRVCAKSSDDGMMLNFFNLNKDEYDFINSNKKWFPPIPEVSKSIDIEYWRDDFFGEFDLTIELSIPVGQQLDSIAYPKWTLIEGRYRFEESSMP